MDLTELLAREEIRELVAAYSHLADTGRFAALSELFTEDALLEPGEQPPARGRAEILRFLGGTSDSLAGTPACDGGSAPAGSLPPAAGRSWIRHHVSNLTIRFNGAEHATGEAYFFVVTDRGPDHWGRYRDRYERRPEGWRFASRRARLDGFAPNSWVAQRRRPS